MSDRDHPFLIEVDMDFVVFTTGSGERFGLTTEQTLKLLDDLGDAVDDANGWTHHNPHERDQTYKED